MTPLDVLRETLDNHLNELSVYGPVYTNEDHLRAAIAQLESTTGAVAAMGHGTINISEGMYDDVPAIYFTTKTNEDICAVTFANKQALVQFHNFVTSLLDNYPEN